MLKKFLQEELKKIKREEPLSGVSQSSLGYELLRNALIQRGYKELLHDEVI